MTYPETCNPSQMYSFAGNAASFHHAPDCNHVPRKERRYNSRSGVQCSPGVQLVRMKHRTSFSPPVWRLCRAASNCSRSRSEIVTEEVPYRFLDCNRTPVASGVTPETDNRLFLPSRSASRQSLPSYSVCSLYICQDVLQHELEQLGMMFHFALLFLRFSSRVHHFDSSLFAPIHEFITDLCTMRINFETARSHERSQPGISQQSLKSLKCFCVVVSKGGVAACTELPSQTTCRVFTRAPSIHPGSAFTSMAMLFGGGWTSTREKIVVPHRGCLAASAGHSQFRAASNVRCVACGCER